MNHCSFLGKLQNIPLPLDKEEGERILIDLLVENKRNDKSLAKKTDYEVLTFEAWGSAAANIAKNLSLNDYMLIIDSTARRNSNDVCFRINEFKIIKQY